MLLTKDTETNTHNWIPLGAASRERHPKVVKLLIENGADVDLGDESSGTVLYLSCHFNHDEIVAILLRKGADVNSPGGI